MDRFRGWARGKVLFARDGAPGAYLDQFARELQALRLELRMETCDVRIGSLASGGPNKARSEDPTWKAAWESKGRDAVRPRTRRLPLRLFMMTTTVTSGYGGSSSSGSRSSLPLGLGRPRSARTSLLMLRPGARRRRSSGKRTGSLCEGSLLFVDSNVRVEAVESALGTRVVLESARTPLSCVEPRAVACSPLNGADARGFVFGAPSRRNFWRVAESSRSASFGVFQTTYRSTSVRIS